MKGYVVEMIDMERPETVPHLPHNKLIIDIGAGHPGSVGIEITVEKRDGRDVGEVSRVCQLDIPRPVIIGSQPSKMFKLLVGFYIQPRLVVTGEVIAVFKRLGRIPGIPSGRIDQRKCENRNESRVCSHGN